MFNLKNLFKPKPVAKINSETLLNIVNVGDVFIDCGANIGQETLKVAEKGAIIHSFEPDPNAFKVLSEKAKEFSNVTLHNKGVGDKPGTLKLYLHKNHTQDPVMWSVGSSFLNFKSNIDTNSFVEVEIVDLAEFIKNLGKRVKVLKLDVEGMEYDIVDRLIESKVFQQIDYIFVETHADKIPELRLKEKALKQKIKKLNIKNINLDWE